MKQEKRLLLSSAPFLHGRKLRPDGSGTEVTPAGKEGSGTRSRTTRPPGCLLPPHPGDGHELTEAPGLAGGKVTRGWEVERCEQSCQVSEDI